MLARSARVKARLHTNTYMHTYAHAYDSYVRTRMQVQASGESHKVEPVVMQGGLKMWHTSGNL